MALVHGHVPVQHWRGRITYPLKKKKIGNGHFVTRCDDCWQKRLDHLRSVHGAELEDAELEELDRGTYHVSRDTARDGAGACWYSADVRRRRLQGARLGENYDEWECCELGGSTRTSYEVLHYLETADHNKLPLTLVKVKITGGRTHQIRVHMMMLAKKLNMPAHRQLTVDGRPP